MTLFSLLESLFFMSLALSFFLIFLMVYHFKKRMDSLDRKNETLGDICKTLIKEIESAKCVRQSSSSSSSQSQTQSQSPYMDNMYMSNNTQQPSFMFESFNGQNPLEELFRQIKEGQQGRCFELDPLDLKMYSNEGLDEVEILDYHPEIHLNPQVQLDDEVEVVEIDETVDKNVEEIVDEIIDEIVEPLDESVLDESSSVFTESVLTSEPDHKLSKKKLKDMNVQMLRELAVRDGLIQVTGSKMKKKELIALFLEETTLKDGV